MKLASELTEAASAAMTCLNVSADDRVLLLCNDAQRGIVEALAFAANKVAKRTTLIEYPTLTHDGEEPPPFVSKAMRRSTVVFAPTTFSLSHTQARVMATRKGVRIATMPGITVEVFTRALPIDYGLLKRVGAELAAVLTASSKCRLTSPAGTDLVLQLDGRAAIADDGDLGAPAAFGNLPAGEAYIAPLETCGEGTVVFDGALAGYGPLRRPLRLILKGGVIVGAEGEGADWLLSTLDAGGSTGRLLAELGIGTNPAARLTGNVLEDEKALGTAHLDFGNNISFGGVNTASVHIDGVLHRPTIELDGRHILHEGKLAL